MLLKTENREYILLAEDDEDDRNIFKDAFAELSTSYDLRVVEDGFELMNFLEKREIKLPSLLLLDLNMPLINGFECLEMMKKNEQLKHIPVIIFSTSANKEDIEKSYSLNAHFYVHKPNSFPKLKEIMEKVLSTDWHRNSKM